MEGKDKKGKKSMNSSIKPKMSNTYRKTHEMSDTEDEEVVQIKQVIAPKDGKKVDPGNKM